MPEPTTPELAEIRAKAFADLTPHERLTWSIADAEGYYAAGRRDARRLVEEMAASARRRRAARTHERWLRPFRWLTRLLGGGRRG